MSKDIFSIGKAFALLSQLGLSIAIPVAGGIFLGGFLDKKLHTGNMLVLILTIVGVIVGFYNGYRLVMMIFKKDDN